MSREIESILEPLRKFVLGAYVPELDAHGNPSLTRCLLEKGRLPFIDDEIKPWKYRGWIVPYIQMGEALHPAISPRYDYVHRTLEAGRLLDEPIPQIEFCGEFEQVVKPGLKMLQKCLDEVEYKSGSWNGMREFCEWIAFAVGVTHEPSKLDDKVQEFLYRNFDLKPLLFYPSDYLGQMLCETNHGKRNGFYPTPIHIVDMMCRMVNHDGKNPLHEKTMDPCVGTGRMLLCASNFSLQLFGQDIDYLCCLITKINLALYAPWFYIPDSFFPSDTPETIDSSDLPENEPLAPKAAHPSRVLDNSARENSDLSLYEKMKLEKEKRKRPRKFTTDIEDLPLFKA